MAARLRPRHQDGVEQGKRLARLDGARGASLAEWLSRRLARVAWQMPLHRLRLRGRLPLKLLAVPHDPIAGDAAAGEALLTGRFLFRGESAEAEGIDFAALPGSPAFVAHVQSFAWLRDLAAAAPRDRAAPIAEYLARRWLAAHAETVDDAGWRPDLWGWRMLHWATHAPLLLSSTDQVYRAALLNTLARGARHLSRSADRVAPGMARIAAWAGVVTAALTIPGGERRMARGEAGLTRALGQLVWDDGGVASRSAVDQIELVELLVQLCAVYEIRRIDPAPALADTLRRAVSALKAVLMGDGALSSWQGGGPLSADRIEQAVEASGVRARALRSAPDWGYQRLVGGKTVVVVDAAPPPPARMLSGGCASTLAFELSDGPHRMIVNCGGDHGTASSLPPDFARALRASAAHSTLILADTNSTAIHPDGALGRGVGVVELARREEEGGSFLDASHDGYERRFGFTHRRHLYVANDGREVRGEDVLDPAAKRRTREADGAVAAAIRFHLAPAVEVSPGGDGKGATLRLGGEILWQFHARGGEVVIEDSVWIDGDGQPRESYQLVIHAEALPGGADIGWMFRRAN
jgi:uncharacterized heparinase superfamily protein